MAEEELAAPLRITAAAHARARQSLRVLRAGDLEGFYRGLDAFFTQTFEDNPACSPQCKSGCGTCCSQWVHDVHPHEVARLGPLARSARAGLELRLARYEEILAGCAGAADPQLEASLKFMELGLPCVFQREDGACGVYALRPYACRRFFSLAPEADCSPAAIRAGRSRGLMLEPDPDTDIALAFLDVEALPRHGSGEFVRELLAWLEADQSEQAAETSTPSDFS